MTSSSFPTAASMWLMIGVGADRTGKKYLAGLDPDEEINPANQISPDDRDPVVQGALRWLNRRPHP